MEERLRFAVLARQDQQSMSSLCEAFGISRKTGYKWLERYEQQGRKMAEQSRRPLHCPHKTDWEVERLILQVRRRRRTWGPKKIRDELEKVHEVGCPPACSTIGEILKRHGLTVAPKRRRGAGFYEVQRGELTQASRTNEVWAADFKGWFLTGDGRRCDPLTVTDLHSRYLIGCRALLGMSQRLVQPVFWKVFRHYGLPEVIRVDNGPPFGSLGIGGLSRLSVWWILQGVEVEYIRPGKPQDNGSHERMHRTLKAEAIRPPSVNRSAQQKRFDRWVRQFNEQRPHESLGMQRPAQRYQASARRLGQKDKSPMYPREYEVHRVSQSGFLCFEGQTYYLGETLAQVEVGLRYSDSRQYEVYFANRRLGVLGESIAGLLRPAASKDRQSKLTDR